MKQASCFFWGLVNNPTSSPASPASNRGNLASYVNSYLSIFPTGIHCMRCTIASSRWSLVHGKSPGTNITLSVQTQVPLPCKDIQAPLPMKGDDKKRNTACWSWRSHGTQGTWPTFLLSRALIMTGPTSGPSVSPHLLSALPLPLTCFLYLFYFLTTKEHLHLKLNRTSWFTFFFHLWLCLKWCSTWNNSNFPNYSETSKSLIYKIGEVALKTKRIPK